MSLTASHHYFRDQHCDYQADQASMEALLNCYCRDIAEPPGSCLFRAAKGAGPGHRGFGFAWRWSLPVYCTSASPIPKTPAGSGCRRLTNVQLPLPVCAILQVCAQGMAGAGARGIGPDTAS